MTSSTASRQRVLRQQLDNIQEERQQGLTSTQQGILAVLILVFVGSITARAMLATPGKDSTSEVATRALEMVAPGGEAVPAAPGLPGILLPYFSEGSLFALIGFCMGFASRKVVRVMMLLVALSFLVLQLLVHRDIATIQWGDLGKALNGLILNLQTNETITTVLLNKIPAVASFVGGWVAGFRRT